MKSVTCAQCSEQNPIVGTPWGKDILMELGWFTTTLPTGRALFLCTGCSQSRPDNFTPAELGWEGHVPA